MLPRRANPKSFAKTMAPLVFAMAFGSPLPSVADEVAILQTPSIEDLIVQRDTKSGSLGFDLDRREWGSFAPGAINFTVRSSERQDVSGPTMESYSPHAADDERSLAYTISAGWGTPDDRVTFSFTTRNSDGGGTNLFVSDPQEDILSLSRSMTSNGWATNFTASLGNSRPDEFGGRTQKLGASASFLKTTDWARGMGITAKIYQDLHTAPGQMNRENDTAWELRTGGDLLFGRARNTNSALPSLSIFFSVKGNSPDQKDADIDDVDVTTGVAGKLTF
ncbi:MAG: hypothetical protein HOM58_05325 [Rhodospirillaceae bacterium]|jgi:hypothetical protein|nr:hypothetical protein [Rhodospirillaceae bacterium]MBT5455404.1 hypothetical protein [Rhodospirillaceae bacterium]